MSGRPFDDAAKSRLAKSIISGDKYKPAGNMQSQAADDTEDAADGGADEQFEGEHDGHIRVETADNGVIVSHDRRKKVSKTRQEGNKSIPYDDHESTTVKRVFQKNDHKGITSHIAAIIKSPSRPRGY